MAVERILQFNKIEEENEEKNNEKELGEWPSLGHIIFENFSMKYKSNNEATLSDINLDIRPLTKTSIIGRTGSGKSSLILSLSR